MRLDFLLLAFKLSKNSRKLPSFFNPPFLSFAGAKVLHFPLPPTTIFTFFQTFSIRAECQQDKFHVFCNNCCRKAVFWRKTRLPAASRGPDPAVFRAFWRASGAFLAEIRPRFTAFTPFQGGPGGALHGVAPYIYVCGRDYWRMCLADVPGGCVWRVCLPDASVGMCLAGRCHARLRRTWLPR